MFRIEFSDRRLSRKIIEDGGRLRIKSAIMGYAVGNDSPHPKNPNIARLYTYIYTYIICIIVSATTVEPATTAGNDSFRPHTLRQSQRKSTEIAVSSDDFRQTIRKIRT
jgi:hypothetical protein